jgi:hypothetical protein
MSKVITLLDISGREGMSERKANDFAQQTVKTVPETYAEVSVNLRSVSNPEFTW